MHPLFEKYQITVKIKRDDLIHPIISGNKWRKLQGNIAYAKEKGIRNLLTFGGSYSNHIHAFSYACMHHGLSSVGIIRGEASYSKNFTLSCAQRCGMTLKFVDRKTYRKRDDLEYLAQLNNEYPDHLLVPEGGSNNLALSGVGNVISELKHQTRFNTLMLPVGSGGTIAGLINADNGQHNILGIAVLKQGEYLQKKVEDLLPENRVGLSNWRIMTEYHYGGYARFSKFDSERIRNFSFEVGIPFEPVYSGKMVLALLDLIEANYFPKGHTVMLLHTGGLQGLAGLIEQDRITASEWLLPPELQAR